MLLTSTGWKSLSTQSLRIYTSSQLPVTAVINYHKLGSLSQWKFFLLQLWYSAIVGENPSLPSCFWWFLAFLGFLTGSHIVHIFALPPPLLWCVSSVCIPQGRVSLDSGLTWISQNDLIISTSLIYFYLQILFFVSPNKVMSAGSRDLAWAYFGANIQTWHVQNLPGSMYWFHSHLIRILSKLN